MDRCPGGDLQRKTGRELRHDDHSARQRRFPMRLTRTLRPRFSMSCGTNWRCTAQVWMWSGRSARAGSPRRARGVFLHSANRRRGPAQDHDARGPDGERQADQLQQAFIDEQRRRCGYCISGMVMRAEASFASTPIRPTMKFAAHAANLAAAALMPPSARDRARGRGLRKDCHECLLCAVSPRLSHSNRRASSSPFR